MATRKRNLEKVITPVLGGTVGFVGSRLLNQVDFIAQNPMLGGAGKIGLGILLATQKGEIVQTAGLGMAIEGASSFVDQLFPQAAGVGYIPHTQANGVLGHHRPKVKVS